MLFKILQETLIVHLRDRVRSGELTERGLARLTGVSQPHIHNVLKGVRSLSVEYADQILEKLGIAPSDLIGAGDLGWEPMHEPVFTHVPWLGGKAGPSKELSDRYQDKVFFPVPSAWAGPLVSPVMVTLAQDSQLYPHFQEGDFALVDRAVPSRDELRLSSVYLVRKGKSTVLRSIRVGGTRLYLLTPGTWEEPRKWEYVPLTGQDLTHVIVGRIVWINRALP